MKNCWEVLLRRKHLKMHPAGDSFEEVLVDISEPTPTWLLDLYDDAGVCPLDTGNLHAKWATEHPSKYVVKQVPKSVPAVPRFIASTIRPAPRVTYFQVSRPRERRSTPVRSQNSTRSSGDPPGPSGGSGDDPDPEPPQHLKNNQGAQQGSTCAFPHARGELSWTTRSSTRHDPNGTTAAVTSAGTYSKLIQGGRT